MYWFIAQVIKNFAYGLRVFQFLLTMYLIMDVVYWFLSVGNSMLTTYIAPMFGLIIGWIDKFAGMIKWNVGADFPMFHPDIFVSILFIIVVLILSNLLFVWIGDFEKKFVEKSYDKGEKDYD